ncbi:MAG: lysophospholipid acyltransferase family protein [Anaerovoracaceae bacterium]
MKIIRNIPSVIKAVYALKFLNKYKKNIAKARVEGNNEVERENIRLAMSTWGTKFLEITGCTLEVKGKENLPKEGPVVYMCNHQGYADIIALCAALDTIQFGYIAKEELHQLPLYGKWIERVRSVMIKRDDPREALRAINEGVKLIEEGFSLMIFPEGTRSRGAEMGEFKKGSMKLATKPEVPVIPISIEGTYKIFEENGVLTPADIKVLVHPAISTKGLDKQQQKELHEKIYKIIYNGHQELIK